jgi:hypothetical protein
VRTFHLSVMDSAEAELEERCRVRADEVEDALIAWLDGPVEVVKIGQMLFARHGGVVYFWFRSMPSAPIHAERRRRAALP